MSQIDWARLYAAMDKRIELKYEQLPKGEQIGTQKQTPSKDSSTRSSASPQPPSPPTGSA